MSLLKTGSEAQDPGCQLRRHGCASFFSTEPASTSATSASKAPQGRKRAWTTAASRVGNCDSGDEMGKLASAAYAISEEKAHQSDASHQQWALESCANCEQKAADHSADHEQKSADQRANCEQKKELHGHRVHKKLEQCKHEQAMQDRHLEVELEVLHQHQEHKLRIANVEVWKMELEFEMMKFKAWFKDPRGD